MKNVTVVELSRPLLLVTGQSQDRYIYQTVYGCVIPGILGDMAYYKVYDYVGYLAGLHCWANGHKLFNITFEPRGVPDWVDKKGRVHLKQDAWMTRVGERCLEKLDLSYDVYLGAIDDETYSKCVSEDCLVLDKEIFCGLKEPVDDESSTQEDTPLWDDGLPF